MLKSCLSIALLSTICLLVSAQVASAELSDTILGSSGWAVPGAKVTARNAGTNIAHDTVSDSTGNHVIPLLPRSNCLVTVEVSSFKKLVRTGLSLQINQQAQLNLKLSLDKCLKRSM